MTAHLDDEALSAVLDGEAGDAEQAHATACAACARRLAELEAVAAAVGANLAVGDRRRREAALATALAVWDAGPGGHAAGAGWGHDGAGAGGEVARAGANRERGAEADAGAEADIVALVPSHRRRNDRQPSSRARWLGAAAVVGLLAVAVPVLRSLDDGDLAEQANREPEAAGPEAAARPGGAGTAIADQQATPAPPADGGDLGVLGAADLSSLTARVQERLAAPRSAAAEAPPAAAAEDLSQAPASDAATPGGGAPAPDPAAAISCESEVRQREPGLGPLVYVARATVEDIAAVVLAFQPPDGGPPVAVVVLAAGSCAPLASAP